MTYFVDYLGEAEGWGVLRSSTGREEFISGHSTKQAAMNEARRLARKEGTDVLVENKSTGSYQFNADYSEVQSEIKSTDKDERESDEPSLPGMGGSGRGGPSVPGFGGSGRGGPTIPGMGFGSRKSDDDDDDEMRMPWF